MLVAVPILWRGAEEAHRKKVGVFAVALLNIGNRQRVEAGCRERWVPKGLPQGDGTIFTSLPAGAFIRRIEPGREIALAT